MQTHWQHGGFVRLSKIFLEIDSHFYVAVVRGTTPGRAPTKLLYSVPEGSRNSNQDQISFYVWLYLIDWDNVSEYHLSDRQSLDHIPKKKFSLWWLYIWRPDKVHIFPCWHFISRTTWIEGLVLDKDVNVRLVYFFIPYISQLNTDGESYMLAVISDNKKKYETQGFSTEGRDILFPLVQPFHCRMRIWLNQENNF